MVPTFLCTSSVTVTLCQFVPGGMIGQIRWRLFTGGNRGEAAAFSGIRVHLGSLTDSRISSGSISGSTTRRTIPGTPDPTADVGCGPVTADEMAHARICCAPATPRRISRPVRRSQPPSLQQDRAA